MSEKPTNMNEPTRKSPDNPTVERTKILDQKTDESWVERMERARKIYNFPEEFGNLEKDMIVLISELKEAIEKGDYNTIISDDVSGRIPTLVLREVIKKVYDKIGSTKKIPDIYFIAFGKGHIDKKAIEEFVRGLNPHDKKALIVTECINSFTSMEQTVKVLEKAGLTNFDIATVAMSESDNQNIWSRDTVYGGDHFYPKRKIFVGHKMASSSPSLYGTSPVLGGIEKAEISNDYTITGAHPKRLDKVSGKKTKKWSLRSDNPKRTAILEKKWTLVEVQSNINNAREDVKTLSQLAVDEVWGNKLQ